MYLPTPDERHVKPLLIEARSIGTRLKYYRLQSGLTQEDLANQVKISKASIIRIEKNRTINIHPEILERIAKALKISPLQLVTTAKENPKNKSLIDYLMPPDTVGARIRNLRFKRGLSLKELTRKAQLSKDCIWRYEKNIAIPKPDILQRIAKCLKISISELTGKK